MFSLFGISVVGSVVSLRVIALKCEKFRVQIPDEPSVLFTNVWVEMTRMAEIGSRVEFPRSHCREYMTAEHERKQSLDFRSFDHGVGL